MVHVVGNVGDEGWMAVGDSGGRRIQAHIYMLLAVRTVPAGAHDEPGCRPPEVGSLRPPEVVSVRACVLSQGADLRRSAPDIFIYI